MSLKKKVMGSLAVTLTIGLAGCGIVPDEGSTGDSVLSTSESPDKGIRSSAPKTDLGVDSEDGTTTFERDQIIHLSTGEAQANIECEGGSYALISEIHEGSGEKRMTAIGTSEAQALIPPSLIVDNIEEVDEAVSVFDKKLVNDEGGVIAIQVAPIREDTSCDIFVTGKDGEVIINEHIAGDERKMYALHFPAKSVTGAAVSDEEAPVEDPAPAGPATSFSDGTHLVGVDIQPGTYRNSGATGRCYWERLSGFGGTSRDIIANDNPRGQSFVTIDASDKAFSSNRCGSWELVE